MDTRPLNILSFDGGGVRGLSSLLILKSLLQRLQQSTNAESLPLPCEVFDLICGTSTGGLIALMLGRLRMDIDEAVRCYLEFSETIFGRKVPWWWLRKLKGSPVYDAAVLETCLRDIVAKHAEGSDSDGNAPLRDPLDGTGRLCRTFVAAVTRQYADAPPSRFRTYGTRSQSADLCTIWEAARATTAATTFFKEMTIGVPPRTYIDGALGGANNPSQLALEEIHEIFPDRPIGCFLSLGTGVPEVVALKGNLADVARACVRLLTSCEKVQDVVRGEFRKRTPEGQENPYFRFSVDRGLATITLDEWTRVEELTGVTEGYLAFDEQKERAEKCVRVLKQRVEEVNAQHEGLV